MRYFFFKRRGKVREEKGIEGSALSDACYSCKIKYYIFEYVYLLMKLKGCARAVLSFKCKWLVYIMTSIIFIIFYFKPPRIQGLSIWFIATTYVQVTSLVKVEYKKKNI